MPLVPSTTEVKTALAFDKEQITAKINAVQANMDKYVGKRNHNPFLWVKTNLDPLIKRLEDGETTPELHNAIMALPDDVAPIVNPDAPEPVKESAPKPAPQGLNLPIK